MGLYTGTSMWENHMAFCIKIENSYPKSQQLHSTPPEMHIYVHQETAFTYNSQNWKQVKCPSTGEMIFIYWAISI